jgi:ABC-type uncharacterized transport system ATPase subunit
VLAPQEIEELMATMRSMVAQGKSIIFISHKLNEVLAVADRITILRRGKATAEGRSMEGVTKDELARLMVGRSLKSVLVKKAQEPGPVVLDMLEVSAENNKGVPALRKLSLQVHRGEILGLAGVAGNGQSELAEIITGLRACTGTGSWQSATRARDWPRRLSCT